MKSLHLSFLVILLFNLSADAQPNPEWESIFNGAGNKSDQPRAMILDAQNNIYIAGPSETKKGNTDIAVVKYNAGGVQQWVATYEGTGNGIDYPNSLAVDADGNVYVTGRSMNKLNYDCITIKYDAAGIQIWEARYNGTENGEDMGNDIKVDVGGNVYVTGYTNSPHTGSLLYGFAVLTLKYDEFGDMVWESALNTSIPDGEYGREIGTSLVVGEHGVVYVTGQNDLGLVTLKLNNGGVEQWRRTFPEGVNGQKILQDEGGNIFVTGWGAKTYKLNAIDGEIIWASSVEMTAATFWDMAMDGAGNVYVGGYGQPDNASTDFLTVKYNGADGIQQWLKTYNGSANVTDRVRSIAVDGIGNTYVTGYIQTKSGRSSILNYGTIKYTHDGDEEWVALYSGPDRKGGDPFFVAVDGAGDVVVTGTVSFKRSGSDFVTIKYKQGYSANTHNTEIQQEILKPSLFRLNTFPNPFNQITTISYQLPVQGNVELIVFDLFGREVKTLVNETKLAGIYNINFSSGNLPAGAYVCRFRMGDIVESRKMVIVR